MLTPLLARLAAPPPRIALYVALYLPIGFAMNAIGKAAEIAEFAQWWQVLTCYGLYLVPWSLVVRRAPIHRQFLWGLLALGLLELLGYTFGTSIAHPDNILDKVFGPRNFSLVMTLFFATYLPLGNALVAAVGARLGIADGDGWSRD